MNSLQEQIAVLDTKVDALNQKLEQLGVQTAEMLAELRELGEDKTPPQPETSIRYSYQSRHAVDTSMEHKDVLVDVGYLDSESQTGERILSPEIQIQRLTAQLTAAYNRIAALEEQLLARRIH